MKILEMFFQSREEALEERKFHHEDDFRQYLMDNNPDRYQIIEQSRLEDAHSSFGARLGRMISQFKEDCLVAPTRPVQRNNPYAVD
ncbi:MAG: hypothetical protein JWM96_746 [Alphaproteobacteria bacterium]|nr:hypothetical protein [Alphaproteobacteria bacterium]